MRRRVAIGMLLAASGCTNIDLGYAARRDTAAALECPSAAVELEQLGEYRYHAEGCGREVNVACSSATLEPHCYVERAAGSEDTPTEDAPPNVEATIRGGLNARRDDVLACVGVARVGVRAIYGGDGTVTFALQGDLHDSPEEACVRDALAGVRVAATGEEGVIVHLVD